MKVTPNSVDRDIICAETINYVFNLNFKLEVDAFTFMAKKFVEIFGNGEKEVRHSEFKMLVLNETEFRYHFSGTIFSSC